MLSPFPLSVNRVRMWMVYIEESRKISPERIGRPAIENNVRSGGDGAQSGATGTKELQITKTNYSEQWSSQPCIL